MPEMKMASIQTPDTLTFIFSFCFFSFSTLSKARNPLSDSACSHLVSF
jgi:hypothetical protein